jgi:hypothetical protein
MTFRHSQIGHDKIVRMVNAPIESVISVDRTVTMDADQTERTR